VRPPQAEGLPHKSRSLTLPAPYPHHLLTAASSVGRLSTQSGLIVGRISSDTMPKKTPDRIELLQGTLDMLILRTLLFGPAHGHQIAKHIQRTTQDLLQVEHGSLYPALHRLERKGWLAAKWESAGKDLKREFKYYRLTPAGRKQLTKEESNWKQMALAIARVMWPAEDAAQEE
jgi:PadR family transcriptional regulator, regulatory protein PadR